jgi:anti-sigma factor RsiW
MSPLGPNSEYPPRDWLAAYVDGELSDAARARIEAWLRVDPQARRGLADQELLARQNEEFWNAVRPPEPDEESWAGALQRIEDGVREPARPSKESAPRRWWMAGVLAASVTAAAVLLVAVALIRNTHTRDNAPVTAEAEEAIYRVAGEDDVQLISLPEAAVPHLIVGAHPMGSEVARAAVFADVDIRAISPDVRGEFPVLTMTPHGGAFPMVWPSAD